MPGSPSRRLRESSVRLLLPKLAGSRQRVAPLSFAMDRRHPEPFPLACVGPLLAVTYLVEVSRIRLTETPARIHSIAASAPGPQRDRRNDRDDFLQSGERKIRRAPGPLGARRRRYPENIRDALFILLIAPSVLARPEQRRIGTKTLGSTLRGAVFLIQHPSHSPSLF